ncbi:thiamine diphosphokinase [Ruminococcus sp.]|uniref:thiamine diphosphokinase n=1 Tax=Ruminococcus sp. TaxID=41978 RepID=UPI0038904B3D
MKRCFIFGALPVSALCEKPSPGDMVIAADKGYDTVIGFGLQPDLTVGDFDSRGKAPATDDLIVLPVRKDQTDVGYAVEVGFSRGYRDFVVYGGVGGMLDHTVANIAIAYDIVVRGGSAVFIGEECCFTVIRHGEKTFAARDRGRLSVFALGGTARGVTIRGLGYELDDGKIACTDHIGVSNEFIGKEATISVKDGDLLIIWQT